MIFFRIFCNFSVIASLLLSLPAGAMWGGSEGSAAAAASAVRPIAQPEDFYLTRENADSRDISRPGKEIYKQFLFDKKLTDIEKVQLSNENKKLLKSSIIPLLETGAHAGDIESLYYLGMIYKKLDNYLIAYKFIVLAVEESWLRGESVFPKIDYNFWKKLLAKAGIGKRRTKEKEVFDFYSQPVTVDRIATWNQFSLTDCPYVTPEEQSLRALRFKVKLSVSGDPWFAIALDQGRDKNYDYAAKCYEASSSSSSWYNLGILYQEGKIGCKGEGTPDYEHAAAYYLKAESPDSWHNLGALYHEGKLGRKDGELDYEQAAKYYLLSKTQGSWFNLGTLYMQGKLGRKDGEPDYKKAEEYYLLAKTLDSWGNLGILYHEGKLGRKGGEPDYKKAEEYYLLAKIQSSWHNLGLLYEQGKLGRKEDCTPDYEKAEKCYLEAKAPGSWYNLGILYASGYVKPIEDGTPNYEEAVRCFLLSKSVDANLALFHICHENLLRLSADAQALKLQETMSRLMSLIEKETASKKEKCLGFFSFYEKNYEEGLSHWKKALAEDTENKHIKGLIRIVEGIIVQKKEVARIMKEFSSTGAASTESSWSDDEEESDEEGAPQDSAIAHPKSKNPFKMMQKELKRKIRIAQIHFRKFGTQQDMSSHEEILPLTISFLNETIKDNYETSDFDKRLKVLIADITVDPRGLWGSGRPERITTGTYAGCISRRIDKKHRLLYKIKGDHSIEIHSCIEHYDD